MVHTREVVRSLATGDDAGTPLGIAVAEGTVLLAAAAGIAALLPIDAAGRFTIMWAAVAGFAMVVVDLRSVAAITLLAFLIVNGFLVDRFGDLSWHGRSDVVRIALLLVAAGMGAAVGGTLRTYGRRRGKWRLGEQLRGLSRLR